MAEKKQKTWWPHHALKAGSLTILIFIVVIVLAIKYQVPYKAPDIVPFSDDGQYIPGPEWYFLLLWQPFWYFTGPYKHLISYSVVAPFIFLLFLIFLPFIRMPSFFKRKVEVNPDNKEPMDIFRKLVFNAPVLLVAVFLAFIAFKSGYQAKILGCDACHNSAMGVRMYLPPVNVVEYYTVDRARQIKFSKYKAGKVVSYDEVTGKKVVDVSGVETYKDANWQMRHMYEPTFTW